MKSGVSDQRLSEYVIQSKLVTPDQVEEARRSQIAAASIGVEMSLAEALVRLKALTNSQRAVIEQRLSTQPATGIQQLGPYKLVRRLGAGAMGVVYLAEDTMAKREVALKVLARELASDPAFLERFHREAVATGKLNHANLITAHNVGKDRGWHYYVMEYCPGESVEKILEQKGPLPWATALRIARDVAQGLQYAHQHGIIHRDVKPGNIMVTPEGAGRLLDMGLSKQLLRPEETRGQTVGTPHYIAPEQAMGAQDLNGRADIYALGATVFHMLTGRPPFIGKDAMQVIQQHLSAPVPDPSQFRADIPERVTRILHKAMAKDLAQRYPDCTALMADLDVALGTEAPTSAMSRRPSPKRPEPGDAPAQPPRGHLASVWGGGEEPAPSGRPASVWGDDSSPEVRPAPGRAVNEPVRHLRSRHASEIDVLSARPRARHNHWRWPVAGAGVLLVITILLLALNGSRPDDQGGTGTSDPSPTQQTTGTHAFPTPALPPEIASGSQPEKKATPAPPPPPDSPPPTPGIDDEDHWKDAIDLLAAVDLTADPVQGDWRFADGKLVNEMTPRSRLGFAYQPPPEYDFRVVFTRKKGDEVTQIVRWKGTGVAWVLGASGNTASGFLRTNMEITPPLRNQESEGITNDARHSTIIEVRQDRIRGYLDGRLLSEWSGEGKMLSWLPGWDLPGSLSLGLGSHNANMVIQSIQVREVSGRGRVLRKPSALTGPGDITDAWKKALGELPPESQIKYVNVKLQQLNPGFTGKVTMRAEDGMLRQVSFQRAVLKDLRPLLGLPHLTGISLGGSHNAPSHFSDLGYLRGLRLTSLDCSYSKVTDLSPLSGMKLTSLTCHHTEISDLSPLKGAPLEQLNCAFTKVQTLETLSEMPLASLDCAGTAVSSLQPLASRPLKELNCAGTAVTNLDPLKGMPLTTLNLNGTGVKNLEVLRGLPLKDLNIGKTKPGDTASLRGLKLTSFSMNGLGAKDIGFLQGMPLEQINLEENSITDLAPLRGTPLAEVRLNNNPVSDLRPLNAKTLKVLHLRNTKVTTLGPLAGAPLQVLDIRGAVLAKPEELATFPLETLFLDYNPKAHAELLKGMKTLVRVNYLEPSALIQNPPPPGK